MKQITWALMIGLLLGIHPAQGKTFKIATTAPDGSIWMKEIREGAAIISKQTKGRVKFKFYTGGIMGSAKSVLKKITIRQLHGGAFTAGDLADVYPDLQIYGLPFLFHNYDEVDYVRSKIDAHLRQGLAQRGMISLGMSEGGFAYFMSDTPVNSVAQLSGKRVWLPEGDAIIQTAYKIAGIAAVPLPLADVYTGLQTGMIDTVGTSATGAIAFQWHTRIKYVVDIPLIYLLGMLVMDRRAFNGITRGDQAIVLKVMNEVLTRIGMLNRQDDGKARQALQQQGIQFIAIDAAERQRAGAIARQTMEILSDKGIFTSTLYQHLHQHLQQFRKTHSDSP